MSKKYRSKIDIVILMFRIFSVIIIFIALCFILNWYLENKRSKDIMNNISSSIKFDSSVNEINNGDNGNTVTDSPMSFKVDFNNLSNQNSNTVGWIKVNNTSINYPIVRYSNNDFYLTHSFDNSFNNAGWIFADYRNIFDGTDKNIIIYGHNRRDGSMFSSLKTVLNKNWYSNAENHNITLYTPLQNISYKVFSVYSIKAETYYTSTNFSSDDNYNEFLSTIKDRSIYNFEENVSSSDSILTLSTCANNNSYRVVLHAKRIIL